MKVTHVNTHHTTHGEIQVLFRVKGFTLFLCHHFGKFRQHRPGLGVEHLRVTGNSQSAARGLVQSPPFWRRAAQRNVRLAVQQKLRAVKSRASTEVITPLNKCLVDRIVAVQHHNAAPVKFYGENVAIDFCPLRQRKMWTEEVERKCVTNEG